MRSKKGIITSDKIDPIYAFIIIIATPDEKNFYLHLLMWIVQLVEYNNFENKWIMAKNDDELKNLIIDSWKKQESCFYK